MGRKLPVVLPNPPALAMCAVTIVKRDTTAACSARRTDPACGLLRSLAVFCDRSLTHGADTVTSLRLARYYALVPGALDSLAGLLASA